MGISESFPNRPFFLAEEDKFDHEKFWAAPLSWVPSLPSEDYAVIYAMAIEYGSRQLTIGFDAEAGEWTEVEEYDVASRDEFLRRAAEDAFEWAKATYPEGEHVEGAP